jgi:ATP-dependent DNA ligase
LIKSELPTEINETALVRLIHDDNFGMQEKHNGERRTICKEGDRIRSWNREGVEGKGLPASITGLLRRHPMATMVLDVEVVKEKAFVIDVLVLDGQQLFDKEYSIREAKMHETFDGYQRSRNIIPVYTARTTKEKLDLFLRCKRTKCEGVCLKDMTASFKQGRSGQHFKFKFWKELDAVVIGNSVKGHDSVEIGVYDGKQLKRIAACTKKKQYPVKPGDVITVEYLYGTGNRNIVQLTMVRKRSDKKPCQCTIDQIEINKNFEKTI